MMFMAGGWAIASALRDGPILVFEKESFLSVIGEKLRLDVGTGLGPAPKSLYGPPEGPWAMVFSWPWHEPNP
jgi:hypothetical protein